MHGCFIITLIFEHADLAEPVLAEPVKVLRGIGDDKPEDRLANTTPPSAVFEILSPEDSLGHRTPQIECLALHAERMDQSRPPAPTRYAGDHRSMFTSLRTRAVHDEELKRTTRTAQARLGKGKLTAEERIAHERGQLSRNSSDTCSLAPRPKRSELQTGLHRNFWAEKEEALSGPGPAQPFEVDGRKFLLCCWREKTATSTPRIASARTGFARC